jgi:hypothetical protein
MERGTLRAPGWVVVVAVDGGAVVVVVDEGLVVLAGGLVAVAGALFVGRAGGPKLSAFPAAVTRS